MVKEIQKINVNADFSGFRSGDNTYQIKPIAFRLESGGYHKVLEVRRVFSDPIAGKHHVHFVIKTTESRYFDILYDSGKISWYLILEVQPELMFEDLSNVSGG